jgi:hypothetical protein
MTEMFDDVKGGTNSPLLIENLFIRCLHYGAPRVYGMRTKHSPDLGALTTSVFARPSKSLLAKALPPTSSICTCCRVSHAFWPSATLLISQLFRHCSASITSCSRLNRSSVIIRFAWLNALSHSADIPGKASSLKASLARVGNILWPKSLHQEIGCFL